MVKQPCNGRVNAYCSVLFLLSAHSSSAVGYIMGLMYNVIRKIWRKLIFYWVVWSQTYNSEILADFNLAARYSIVIRIIIHMEKTVAEFNLAISWSICQTAKFNSPTNFLVTYSNTVEPPNKGHFGNGHFVLFSEAVPISEACHCLTV